MAVALVHLELEKSFGYNRDANRIIMSDKQTDLVKIVALGHQFSIGTLYNYVEGTVVQSKKMFNPLKPAHMLYCLIIRYYALMGPGGCV